MNSERRVRRMVRRVLYRTLGRGLPPQVGKALVSEADIMSLPPDSEYAVPAGALLTPLARQIAMDRRIRLIETGSGAPPPGATGSARVRAQGNPTYLKATGASTRVASVARSSASAADSLASSTHTIALGSDHAGFALKEALKGYLVELGYSVVDCGTSSPESVDYPDFALAVAQRVAQGQAWRGIALDGAGIGSCMAANKVPGVRAALCYDLATALNSREHNDANVLTLGAGLIGPNLARQIVKSWLEARFGGDRHARRIDKITQIERRYCR